MHRICWVVAVLLLTGCHGRREPREAVEPIAPEPVPGPVHRRVVTVDVSSGGRYVVTGESDGSVTLWDVRQEQPLDAQQPGQGTWSAWTGRDNRHWCAGERPVRAVAFGPGDRTVYALSAEGEVIAYDRATGGRVCSFRVGEWVEGLFVPGGQRLVTNTVGHLEVWEVATGRRLLTVPLPDTSCPTLLGVRPDGKRVLVTREFLNPAWHRNYDELTELDLETGKETGSLGRGIHERFQRGGYLPGGLQVWSAEWGAVAIWDLRTGAKVVRPRVSDQPHADAFSPDGRLLATTRDGRTFLHEAGTGRPLDPPPSPLPPGCRHFFPDGRRLLIYGGRGATPIGGCNDCRMVLVWDPEAGRLITLAHALTDY